MEAFVRNFPSEVEKCMMWSSIQVLPNEESHAKLHKKPSETLGAVEFTGYTSVSTVFLGTLTDFRCILHSVRLQV